jgi:hypothetical protein
MEAASGLGAPMRPMSAEEAAGKLWWIFIVTGTLAINLRSLNA